MKVRTLFTSLLLVGFFVGLIAVAPFPNNPFSFKQLWKQSGLQKQEESRRQLMEQRKKMASKILRQKLQEIEENRKILMENRKIAEDQIIENQYLQQQKMQELRDRMNDLRDNQK